MKIKILSDSTCDLSADLLAQYDITLAPLTVVRGGEQYKDGVTITSQDIFAHVAAGGDLCSTAAVSIGEYADLFERYSSEYDGIIHINIGAGFSACHQNARLAAEDFPNVRCIDSGTLSTGQGLIVLQACRLAASAESLDQLVSQIESYTSKVEASFIVERLDYLVKGGRCSSAAALGANLLNLKPCIEVKDSKMFVTKKYRGNFTKCLTTYVRERLTDREDLDPDTIFITGTVKDEQILQPVRDEIAGCFSFRNVFETNVGCTVACHCGPGTLGIFFLRK